MARILILSLVFPPDGVSTSQLYGELARGLRDAGHDVVVITTRPHYNEDIPAHDRQMLTPFWGRLLSTSRFHGITVYHTAMPKKGRSFTRRLCGWLGFHIISAVAACTLARDSDVLLTPSPPLTIGVVAWLIGKVLAIPYVYNVHELYPECAVALGVVRNPTLIRLLRAIEQFVYNGAYAVTPITEGMRRKITGRVQHPSKVVTIPNFADVARLQPVDRDNAFSREFSLGDRFTVLYAGNLGPAQHLGILLDAAAILQERAIADVQFVLVGDGASRDELAVGIRTRGLHNMQLIPYQPYDRVPDIYATGDLCVVPLLHALAFDAAPSKVYRIMACGRAVLALTASDSDLADIVTAAGGGIVVDSKSPEAVARAILECQQPGMAERMGASGRRYAVQHFDRQPVVAKYSELLGAAAHAGARVSQ